MTGEETMRREKTPDREPKPDLGESGPEDRGRKTEGGTRVRVRDSQSPGQEKAPPDKHTCFFCAYACLMPRGPSFLMGMNLRRPLVCLNHPDAAGEFREVLASSTCPNFLACREPPLRVPPPEPPNDKVKFIALTKGQHAMVDAADFEWLNEYKWHAARSSNGRGYYAARWENGRLIFMHRQIMNAPDDVPVDHVNRSPGDNRRENLRFCTFQQNTFNRRVAPHSSRFQGVHFYKTYGKWVADIKIDQQKECLGYYDDEVEAAQVRDRWAFALHGRFAYLNFPEDFVGKDPADPEFQALRAQLAEKRRKRGEKKNSREEKQKGQGKSKKAKGKKPDSRRRGRRRDKPEDGPTS